MLRHVLPPLVLVSLMASAAGAQVSSERLLRAAEEPQNWLTYSWTYHYAAAPGQLCCRGLVNRGVAILGDALFMATVDAHLVAIDAKNGHPLWNTKVAEAK